MRVSASVLEQDNAPSGLGKKELKSCTIVLGARGGSIEGLEKQYMDLR